jgi:DNA-binding protein H-NS
MELSELSFKDLQDLLTQIPKEIKLRQITERGAALREIRLKAEEMGWTIDDLIDELSKYRAARFRHPSDPELVWSGRGRKPMWVQAFLENGGTMAQLEIT